MCFNLIFHIIDRLRAEERKSLETEQKVDKERKRKICGFAPKVIFLNLQFVILTKMKSSIVQVS